MVGADGFTFDEAFAVMSGLALFNQGSATGGDAVAQSAYDKVKEAVRIEREKNPAGFAEAEARLEMQKRMQGLGRHV